MSIGIYAPGETIYVGRRPGVQMRGGGAAAWYRAGGAPAPVAAYQPIGAASLAASYVNLANPGTNNAAPGVAPTFAAATGWTFNGTTQYLTTGIIPAAGYSAIARYSALTNSGSVFGKIATDAQFFVRPNTPARVYAYGNTSNSATTGVASGVIALAGPNGYFNGALGVELAATFTGTPIEFYIGARNSAGAANNPIAANIQAVAIYSATLTLAQIAAVTTAMQAL